METVKFNMLGLGVHKEEELGNGFVDFGGGYITTLWRNIQN